MLQSKLFAFRASSWKRRQPSLLLSVGSIALPILFTSGKKAMKREGKKQIEVKSGKTTSSFWKNSSRFNSRVSWRARRRTNYLTWGKISSWRWRRWRMKFLLRNHNNWFGNLDMPIFLFWLRLALKILSRQGQGGNEIYVIRSFLVAFLETNKNK